MPYQITTSYLSYVKSQQWSVAYYARSDRTEKELGRHLRTLLLPNALCILASAPTVSALYVCQRPLSSKGRQSETTARHLSLNRQKSESQQ